MGTSTQRKFTLVIISALVLILSVFTCALRSLIPGCIAATFGTLILLIYICPLCRFVSALKDPKSLLLRAQEAADEAAELALRRGERSDGRGQGKRVSVKTGTTSTASAAAVRFNPDAALLYNLIKSCQQRDVANAWYDSFVSAVKGRPWDEVTTDKRKKRRNLDETTILKCRFASALYELEKSGIIKCQSVGPHNPTVTIEKKIYTWI